MQKQQEQRGLTCPNEYCKTLIPFTYEELLTKTSKECSKCRLKLNMSVSEDIKVHIENLANAEKEVERVRNYKG